LTLLLLSSAGSCIRQRKLMSDFTLIPESIAFPALSDEQLATLESLGTRRKVNRGEIVYKRVSATCLSILS